jgi:hypothetical protein
MVASRSMPSHHLIRVVEGYLQHPKQVSFPSVPRRRKPCFCHDRTHMKSNLCLELGNLLLDALLLLGLGELVAPVLLGFGLPLILGLLVVALLLLPWVLTDLLVGILVELLKTVSLKVVVDVAAELGLVALLIVIGKGLHVLSNVTGEDVLAESLGIELLALDVETGEAVLGVGNEDTTVGAALHGTEDTGTSGSADETDIQEDLEWAALLTVDLSGLGESELTVSLLDTDEVLVHLELLEGTAGKKETGGVSGRPVGQTVGDTVGLELVGTGVCQSLCYPLCMC